MSSPDANELLARLLDPDESVAHAATLTLGSSSTADPSWVPDLIAALDSSSSEIRFWSTVALGCVGADASSAASALLGRLRDPKPAIRGAAVRALSLIAPAPGDEAVAAMLTLLHTDPDPFVREGTVEALGRLSAGHVSALDGLVAALHDDVAGVRRRAAIQLKVLGTAAAPRAKAARHALTRLADDDTEEPELRTQARAAIDAMGSAPL